MTSGFKRVLLINPPESGQGADTSAPMGLMFIAGVLQQNGIAVRIVDGCLDGFAEVMRVVAEFKPDLAGIACPTYARVQSFKIARAIKEHDSSIITLFGGHHPTLLGQQVLANYPFVDLICIGEGEFVTLDLCQGLEWEKISGLGFRRNGAVMISPRRPDITDLDRLPLPAWDLIDPMRYRSNGDIVIDGIDLSKEVGATISFSRGCIGRCNFCSQMWKKWKYRSPQRIMEEIELLHRRHGIRCFHFNDDCFSVKKEVTLELCRLICERKWKIYFSIVTRADCVDEDILRALKEAGCYSIAFGIETASPRLLKVMHKTIKPEQSLRAIQLTNAFGIRSLALVIAGAVGETWESINETIDFLNAAKPALIGVANGLMLFPGTEVYEAAKARGFIDDDFWLTNYNWKIYTAENSRLMLNIFAEAIHHRQKLSRFRLVNMIRYHRFVSREVGIVLKQLFVNLRLVRERSNKDKPFILR